MKEEQDSQHDIKDFTWFQFHYPVTTENIQQISKIEEADPFGAKFFFEFILKHSWKKK